VSLKADSENALHVASFRTVADYTYDWESWHAPDGCLIWVNPAVERITGYSPDECLQMADYPLPMTAPEHRELISEILQEAKVGTSRNDVEFQAVDRSGGKHWVAVSWQPMYDQTGRHLGFRTSIRDITERRNLRDQLRLHAEHLEQLVQERTARIAQLEQHRRQMEKHAAMGQLAAGVAHEINNPLAGIRNAFELIKSGTSPDHEHYELIGLIDREIDRMSSIVHQMYQLYGRSRQQPQTFTIEQTIADVVTLLERTARQHQVVLKTGIPTSERTTVLLPEGEVKQILYNLILNAIQASPAGEDVSIRIRCDSGEVQVMVSDQGQGITADVLPQIFDPFFSTRVSTHGAGMGLGLSVSRNLIESMGGSIVVESTPGCGSHFTAIFPEQVESIADE
jgi:two-component system sporulation sensor kinase C